MKKVVKRISIALVLILSLTLGIATYSFAEGNYHDTAYKYNFSSWQPYAGWNTEKREKRDYTSSYMSCTSASGLSYTASVVGSNSATNEYVSLVGSPSYRFYDGYTYFMINYVKEKNYRYAAIQGIPDYSGNYTATGLWSPDSI